MVVSRGTRGIEAYDVPVRVQGVVHRTDAAVLTLVLTPLVLTRKETTTLTLTSYIIGQEWVAQQSFLNSPNGASGLACKWMGVSHVVRQARRRGWDADKLV
jgi:hypothetical protein